MATRSELDTLMADTRLSADARVLGYYVAGRSERGAVEIEADELEDALSADPSPTRRRQALRQLERRGYLERTPGGRGHADRFAFRVPDAATLMPDAPEDRVPEKRSLSDRVPAKGNLNPDRVPSKRNLSLARDAVSSKPAGDPPIVPRAVEALDQHAELLEGCRGALRDYLAGHVQADKQRGYVQTLATWLNGFGFVWRDASGSTIAADDRTGLVAAALNELDAQGEEAMKYPAGDPRNLRTKLEILCKPIERKPRPRLSSQEEQRHYQGHRDRAAARTNSGGGPRTIGGSSKAPEPTDADRAQRWAAEHPDDFDRIKEEVAQEEGIDLEDSLDRIRLMGLALQRVQRDQLTA